MHEAHPGTTIRRFYTPAEVASLLKVSSTTVLRWIHEERLPAVRISERIYRIPAPAFERFQSGARRPAYSGRLRPVKRHPDLPIETVPATDAERA